MKRYIFIRGILGFVTLVGVSIIIFVAARLSGDVALLLAPQDATDQEIHEIRVQFGLDKPIPIQYLAFFKKCVAKAILATPSATGNLPWVWFSAASMQHLNWC